MPFDPGRTWLKYGVANAVLGGWNLSTIGTLQTGQWPTPTIHPTGLNSYDPTQINDQSNTNVANRTGGLLRPDCVGNPISANQMPSRFFNIDAFTSTPPGNGRFGSFGVGIMQVPGMIDLDLGMAKQFTFKGRFRLGFEASFTNVLNPYGPKTRFSPCSPFPRGVRLRNPPIPRWPVFGLASKGTIGHRSFGSVRRIGACPTPICACFFLDTGWRIRTAVTILGSRGLVAQAAAR